MVFSSNHLSKYSSLTVSIPSNGNCRSSSDHHFKVDGRDRRVSLPPRCAKHIVELKEKLGHRYAGQTIEWLLKQAKPYVDVVIGTRAIVPLLVHDTTIKVPSLGLPAPYPSRFNLPVVPSPASTRSVPRAPSTSSKDGLDIDMDISAEEIAKILHELFE